MVSVCDREARARLWPPLLRNMSYHAEHHLYLSISFHRLPAANTAVRDRLAVCGMGMRGGEAADGAALIRSTVLVARG